MPHELTGEKRKKAFFKVLSSLIPCNNNEPFLDRMCDHDVIAQLWHATKVDFIWQPVMTSSVIGLGRSSKALPKAKLAPKKGPGRGWVVCCQSAFWIPVKPLHPRSMLSKSMQYTENCKACSQHWSTERAQFFSMTKPDHTSHNQCFKSWPNWATKFCHIHLTSHQLTTTSSSILTTFCRENISTTSRKQKMLSKNLSIPKVWVFML